LVGGGPTPTHLVVGLGNPGAEYRATRHNVGFRVVEELARRWGAVPVRGECNARLLSAEPALLVQPQTYMNRSGYAVRCLVERHGVQPENVLVVLDEVALPLGRLRLRAAGSPGGHRGLESVLEQLQSDQVPRLRLGVRAGDEPPAGEALVDFVLAPFMAAEEEIVAAMVLRAADAVEAWRQEGPDLAAARFNGAP
jgi:peptidyl-tRNA hydrolase, PTH1 family